MLIVREDCGNRMTTGVTPEPFHGRPWLSCERTASGEYTWLLENAHSFWRTIFIDRCGRSERSIEFHRRRICSPTAVVIAHLSKNGHERALGRRRTPPVYVYIRHFAPRSCRGQGNRPIASSSARKVASPAAAAARSVGPIRGVARRTIACGRLFGRACRFGERYDAQHGTHGIHWAAEKAGASIFRVGTDFRADVRRSSTTSLNCADVRCE